ncbi:MAG: hypothetical protein LBQ52_09775 [Helicobacteraceae bacterium]|jgi:hypothetical protein|nr:hypothetical protein [Helicobacteraceae bacterium]
MKIMEVWLSIEVASLYTGIGVESLKRSLGEYRWRKSRFTTANLAYDILIVLTEAEYTALREKYRWGVEVEKITDYERINNEGTRNDGQGNTESRNGDRGAETYRRGLDQRQTRETPERNKGGIAGGGKRDTRDSGYALLRNSSTAAPLIVEGFWARKYQPKRRSLTRELRSALNKLAVWR